MKVFIWNEIMKCGGSYHPEGGVVVFAESESKARELANAVPGCEIRPDENPDEVRTVVGGDERVFIMPNAGCC